MNKIIKLLSIMIISTVLLTGCGPNDTTHIKADSTGDIEISYEAIMYDNQGNNYITFKGNSFDITPNKVKQWGYSTDGEWESWYETSSVVTIKIDGSYVQSCGSTVIFKDSRLEITPLLEDIGTLDSSTGSGYTVSAPKDLFRDYYGLRHWWYDRREKGQGGSKIVLLQSQDGYNIGIIEGDNITWEIAEKLPKTTKVVVDGMPVYIHRCNFTIIDTELFNKMPEE